MLVIKGLILEKSTMTILLKTEYRIYKILRDQEDTEFPIFPKGTDVIVSIQNGSKESESFFYRDIYIFRDSSTTISNLHSMKYATVYGYVLHYSPPMITRGTDYLFSLRIVDETGFIDLKIFIGSFMDLKYFLDDSKKSQAENLKHSDFNDVFRKGDILEIKNVKLASNLVGKGLVSKAIPIKDSITVLNKLNYLKNTDEEMENINEKTAHYHYILNYIMKKEIRDIYNGFCNETLFRDLSSSIDTDENMENKNYDILNFDLNPKLKRIKDLKVGMYVDIVGKVLFLEKDYKMCVCVTDYTRNELLKKNNNSSMYDEDKGDALYVNIYGGKINMLNSMIIGGWYLFRNIKIKSIEETISGEMLELLKGSIICVENKEIIKRVVSGIEKKIENPDYRIESGSFYNENIDRSNNPESSINGTPGLPYILEAFKTKKGKLEDIETTSVKDMETNMSIKNEIVFGQLLGNLDDIFPERQIVDGFEEIKVDGRYLFKCNIEKYQFYHDGKNPHMKIKLDNGKDQTILVAKWPLSIDLISRKEFFEDKLVYCLFEYNRSYRISILKSVYFNEEELSVFLESLES